MLNRPQMSNNLRFQYCLSMSGVFDWEKSKKGVTTHEKKMN